MKDHFTVNFNMKKVALLSLVSVVFTLACIYFAALPTEELPNTARLPKGRRIGSKSIIRIIMIIGTLFFGIISIFLLLLIIKLTFINRAKKFLVINKDGILWYKPNIFSKPILIAWKHIEDVCVFNPKDYLFTNNDKHLKNKIIALKLTQEFYNNSSFFAKIIYRLNRNFSKGYEIHINLNFSNFNANEILNEIKKYRFK